MDAAKKIPAAPPTPDQIRELLKASDRAVEEAVLRLHARQTQDEQVAKDTKHKNCRGFSAAHARTGSKYAGWITGMREKGAKPGECLRRGDHKVKARALVLHYVRQLHDEAVAKWNDLVKATERIEEMQPLPRLDDIVLVNVQAHAAQKHGQRLGIPTDTLCICGGMWLGDTCETQLAQAADVEDSRRAAEAKAARDQAQYRAEQGVLLPGTVAQLASSVRGCPERADYAAGSVLLPAGTACLVLCTQINHGFGALYLTCALFGARKLWVPAQSLRQKA